MSDTLVIRVRHGVRWDPRLGQYRAMRCWWPGELREAWQWLGPWRDTDAAAQVDTDRGSAEYRWLAHFLGLPLIDRENPDMHQWQPVPRMTP